MTRQRLADGDAPTFTRPSRRQLEYLPGQIVMRVHEEALRPQIEGERVVFDVETAGRLPDSVGEPLDYLRREAGAREVRPLFGRGRRLAWTQLARRDRHRLAVVASVADVPEPLAGLSVIELPQKEVTPDLLRHVARARGVDFVEPMPARWLLAEAVDPQRNRQWGLPAIRWFEASCPDAAEIRVAVVDSGVDTSHPDLEGPSIPYDHEGTSVRDVLGHGTHVCGTIAAEVNNVVGITGISNCRLAVWKVLPDEPTGRDFYVDETRFLRALGAVIGSEAKVVNLSLGGIHQSQAEQVVLDSLEAAGVTVVAGMGNEYQYGNPTIYPAGYNNVLAVGAVNEAERRAPFSTTGRKIGLVGPGTNILSTVPTVASKYRPVTRYASWSGTSFAAPHVAAAAALLAVKNPDWTPAEIRDRLQETARKLEDMKGSDWTQAYGNGMLDLKAALS